MEYEYEKPMNASQTAKFAGISRGTLWRHVKEKKFPERLKYQDVAIGWTKYQIVAWQQAMLKTA
jgi:predicted DNA-binding transcriptional regulator AlpA